MKWLRNIVVAAIALLASCLPAPAQSPVTVVGAVQPGHCVSFFSTTQIQDTGAGCGLGGGGVSSVGLSLPVNTFAVAGSPVTTSGTLVGTLINQSPNTFFAGPSTGVPTTPTWRAITSTDLPLTSPAQGGTGLINPSAHSLLIAEGAANFNLITATSAGRMILDQGSGLDWAAVAMSADCTLIATGAITCTKTNGTAFGTFATQNFATPPAIGGTTPNAGTFSTLSAASITDTGITGSTQCLQVNATGLISGIGASCGAVGPVSSVSNADGTVTISPTTGNVIVSLALGHANTWTALQTFSSALSASAITDTGITGSTQCVQASAAGVLSGTGAACGSGSGAVNSVTNADGTLTISPTTGAVVASLNLAHANTWTATQTINGASFSITGNQSAPSWTTHGIRYVNVPATLTDTSATGTVAAQYTGFFGGNTIAASNPTTFTNYYEYYYTAPIPGSNVTFSNSWALGADSLRIAGNATIAGALTINTLSSPLSLANGGTNASLTASNGGIIYSTASAFAVLAGTVTSGQCLLSGSSAAPSWGACPGAVASVSNADGTLTISPTTGVVVASLALGHANTWTAVQTHNNNSIALLGSSTGSTTFSSANAGASNFTATFPANTGTLAELNLAQTFSAGQTFSSTLTFSGVAGGSQVSCLGLTAANLVAISAGACGTATGGGNTPTKQVFTTGSGTYTTPANVRWIDIILVGGGGGGGGSEGTTTIGGAGGVGGNTCWNSTGAACTTPVYQAGGGTAGTASSSQGPVSGGTVSGSGTCDFGVAGGDGSGPNIVSGTSHTGGLGGVTIFGGNGAVGGTSASLAPSSNSGSGGAGGASTAGNGGVGGAAGAACRVIIAAPAATYTYAVGAAGTAGAAGTGTGSNAGTVGAAGVIIVYEYYGSSGSNPAGANSNVQFNNSGAFGGNAGFTYDATSLIGLGVAGTSVGKVQLFNATSGSITLQPTTGALGSVTATLPANTGTIAELNLAQTFSAAQTFSSSLTFSGVTTGTQVSCLGLTAANLVATSTGACGSGGGGTPGGSNTQVQFNNSGAFGGDAGFTYAGTGQATLALGTITANAKALNITGTWNNAAVNFDAPLFMNITDTASLGGSATTLSAVYLDIQRSSGTIFAVYKGPFGLPTLWFAQNGSDGSAVTLLGGGGNFTFTRTDVGPSAWILNGGLNGVSLPNSGNFAFSWQPSSGATPDLVLRRDGAGILHVANGGTGAAATTVRVYNVDDGTFPPTNYERAVLDWTTTSNVLTIGTQKGGTGTGRMVVLTSAATNNLIGIGGTTSSFPAFRVFSTSQLDIVLADASAFAQVNALAFGVSGGPLLNVNNLFLNAANIQFGGSGDPTLHRAASNVIEINNGTNGVLTGTYLNWGGEARVTSDFSVTSSTTLTNVTGLSVNVAAGRTYNFQTELFVTDAAAGGVQAAIAGTATATAIQYTGYTIADNAIKAKANGTALATAYGSTTTTETAGIIVRATGTITVNAAGTLTVQMAQNTSNATATIAKRGSFLIVHDMP